MASQLFHDLYDNAFRLDCALIYKLNEFAAEHSDFFPFNTTDMVPLIEEILTDWSTFKAQLHHVASRHRMYHRRFKERCPQCGQADCPGAEPMVPQHFSSPYDLLHHLIDKP